jgi:hypothetical protein
MTPRLTTGLVALALALAACGDSGDEPAAQSAIPQPWSLVALGDSVAMAVPECDGCTSFVDLWGRRLSRAAQRPVEVSNHAVPQAEARDVLDQVSRDGATRGAVEEADLIVIALGIDEPPWNREYETVLEAILDELDTLRAGAPTTLRLATFYESSAVAQCRLVEHHGGRCVRVHRKSDNTHPGPTGHRAITELLLQAGAPKEER